MTETALLHKMVAQLVEVQDQSHEVIVVHGGGKQIKHYLDRLGVSSHFHNGLRVTDSTTMQVVQMVLAGLVNKDIVAAFARQQRHAVGLCGGDGSSFVTRKFADTENFDYGYVGEVYKGDAELINLLLSHGYVPVVACIGMGEEGAYYNVNADEMAAAAAIFCAADRLIFLTDVPGILGPDRNVVPRLDPTEMSRLRSLGVISEGMLPKTRACERALKDGIRHVHIISGREPEGLTRVLLKDEPLGTTLVH